jgi:hypothetical protein
LYRRQRMGKFVHCSYLFLSMYVFVLQSLRDSEPKTGKAVHDFLDKEKIANEFHEFKSKCELLTLLEKIKNDCIQMNVQPFVHFDCHGNNNGIGIITDGVRGQLITWKEVLDQFIEIYRASSKGSIVCMSSCNGFSATRMVGMGKACPYDHIVGSLIKIPFRKSLEAYKRFYKAVAAGTGIFEAGVAIHNAQDLKALQMMAVNRDTLWNLMIRGYERDQLTPEALEARKAYLLTELKRTFPNPLPAQLAELDYACSEAGQRELLAVFERRFFS